MQAQDQYPLRTAIDQRGKQTLNREAKSVSRIGKFEGNIDSIIKWTLNRASQAKITAEQKLFAQVNKSEEMHKAFRPHQIRKSENWTATLAQIISQDFFNPFDCNLDCTKLYNLSSGVPVDETSCLGILSIKGDGEKRYHDFVDSRLLSEETKFYDPLTKSKYTLFRNCSRKVNMLERSGKLKAVEVNRNVFGTLVLLALSARSERLIDFQKALSYPLCSVPLSLANPDGSRRTTQKSKLSDVIYENSVVLECGDLPPKTSVIAYLVDLMALIRTQTKTPATYEELALKLFMAIPPGYKRIDIVADTYRHTSIKDPECSKRGCSEAIIVRSGKSKIPQNFTKFCRMMRTKPALLS